MRSHNEINQLNLEKIKKPTSIMYSTINPKSALSTYDKQISKFSQQQPTTKRTHRYRQSSLNRTLNRENISAFASVSSQYKNQLKLNLPSINKKKDMKKGFLLEEWLNQALEGGSFEEPVMLQPLHLVKKYEIDHKFLVNQNLSTDNIKKIYQSLFVYSQGIKNTFDELLSHMKSENDNERLIKTFWRAFTKLLQSSTPIQTSFQIIEKQIQKDCNDLKEKLNSFEAKMQEERNQYEEKIDKLKKEYEEIKRNNNQLQLETKIALANLELTEANFNDEVDLRLKFQEKINLVSISYNEIKDKYTQLRQELGYKKQSLNQQENKEKQIQIKLNEEIVKVQDLTNRLSILQQKIIERDEQIEVKKQEIVDLSTELHEIKSRNQEEQNTIEKFINTVKSLKIQIEQKQQKIQISNALVKQQNERMNKTNAILLDCREKNDDLFLKYHQTSDKITPMQDCVDKSKYQIAENLKLINDMKTKLEQYQSKNSKCEEIIQKYEQDVENYKKEVHDKTVLIEKNSQAIKSLKEIKDKFQLTNQYLNKQIDENKVLLNHQMVQLSIQINQNYALQTQLEEMKIAKQALEASDVRQKMFFKEREYDLQKQINQKELAIVKLSNEFKNNEKILGEERKKTEKYQQKIRKLQNQSLKNIQEHLYLKNKVPSLEKERGKFVNEIQQLNLKYEQNRNQNGSLKISLSSKQYALEKKRSQVDIVIINLQYALNSCKQTIIDKMQYVHPMIVQDYQALIQNLQNKLVVSAKQAEIIQQKYLAMKSEKKATLESLAKRQRQLKLKQQQNGKLQENVVKMHQKLLELELNYQKQIENNIEKLKEQELTNSKQISKYQQKLIVAQNQKRNLAENIVSISQKLENSEKSRGAAQRKMASQRQQQLKSNFKKSQKLVSNNTQEVQTIPIQITNVQQKSAQTDNDFKHNQEVKEQKEKYDVEIAEKMDKNEKKVQNKDFKKALRLTYLRR